MKIHIVNESTVLTDATVTAALPALTKFANMVCSAWDLKTTSLDLVKPAPVDSWQIVILDDSDQAGALGYHDFTPGGRPISKVFAKTDKQYGYSWSVTLTHELAEMLVDPWIADAMEIGQRFYAKEVGDPVEADALGFTLLGVLVSDFITPAWFIPNSPGPYDHQHHCSAPLQILPGGYAQYFASGSWHQVNPQGAAMAMDPADQRIRTRFKAAA